VTVDVTLRYLKFQVAT